MAPDCQVIELPVKHPELFEALGIAQPKVIAATIRGFLLFCLFSSLIILLSLARCRCL